MKISPPRSSRAPAQRPRGFLLRRAIGALGALVLTACHPSADADSEGERGRDATTRTAKLAPPLPPGQAFAFFRVATSGDQMGQPSQPARLEVVVRVADREVHPEIATCTEPSLGSALAGGTERELEVALCDGEFWLISEPGRVYVSRVENAVEKEQRGRVDLGDPVLRATSPAVR